MVGQIGGITIVAVKDQTLMNDFAGCLHHCSFSTLRSLYHTYFCISNEKYWFAGQLHFIGTFYHAVPYSEIKLYHIDCAILVKICIMNVSIDIAVDRYHSSSS